MHPIMDSHEFIVSRDQGEGRCHWCSLTREHHLYGPPIRKEVTVSVHCKHCPEGCAEEHEDTCVWGCQDG